MVAVHDYYLKITGIYVKSNYMWHIGALIEFCYYRTGPINFYILIKENYCTYNNRIKTSCMLCDIKTYNTMKMLIYEV